PAAANPSPGTRSRAARDPTSARRLLFATTPRLSNPLVRHYRKPMSDLAPTASPDVLVAGTARREGRWRLIARNAFPFLAVGLIWEAVAHLDIFPRRLFPPLETVASAFVRLTEAGILPHHVFDTLVRLAAGFALAGIAGVAVRFAMGRSRRGQAVFLPVVSCRALMPRPTYPPS